MKNNILYILKKELREMFRDKKSLVMMLIIPFMIPLVVIGLSAFFEAGMNKPIEEYNKIGLAYEVSDVEESILKEVGIDYSFDTEQVLKEKYESGEISLYVTKDDTKYIINGENNDTSVFASSLVEAYISSYKEYLQHEYLNNNGIIANDVINIISLEKNLTEEENYYANYMTVYAFLFIIMAITVSATYPATDTTAGEKERGTLETLLTFPIKSSDIIIGKFLGVSISSFITGILSLILVVISLLIANNMFSIYDGVNMMLSASSLIFSIIVIIAYSLLISGLCIAIASNSKTFKEAQSALTPLTFISFFPGMFAFMVNLKTTALLSMVPFLNFTLLFTDITNNTVNYLNMFLMFISTIIIITVVLMIIIKQYKSEKVLFSK